MFGITGRVTENNQCFYVSMLRRYKSNMSHVISTEEIEIQPNLSYEEEPIEILVREVKELRNKYVPLMKVLWRSILWNKQLGNQKR